jgi:hypothetical protein
MIPVYIDTPVYAARRHQPEPVDYLRAHGTYKAPDLDEEITELFLSCNAHGSSTSDRVCCQAA